MNRPATHILLVKSLIFIIHPKCILFTLLAMVQLCWILMEQSISSSNDRGFYSILEWLLSRMVYDINQWHGIKRRSSFKTKFLKKALIIRRLQWIENVIYKICILYYIEVTFRKSKQILWFYKVCPEWLLFTSYLRNLLCWSNHVPSPLLVPVALLRSIWRHGQYTDCLLFL